MQAAQKTMTAFRIEPSILEKVKERAKTLNLSVNSYITNLIVSDLNKSLSLPKASFTDDSLSFAGKYSGILNEPSEEELENDERLKAIWER